ISTRLPYTTLFRSPQLDEDVYIFATNVSFCCNGVAQVPRGARRRAGQAGALAASITPRSAGSLKRPSTRVRTVPDRSTTTVKGRPPWVLPRARIHSRAEPLATSRG